MGANEPDGQTELAVSITVIRGPDLGSKHQMTGTKVVLGRKRADFMLKDREVSGIHASIERLADGRFILRDLGSTNGTFVDGRRIASTEIKPGQQIKVGANYLLFTATLESPGDTTRHHASGELSGPFPMPAPQAEIVFGRTAVSSAELPPLATKPSPPFVPEQPFGAAPSAAAQPSGGTVSSAPSSVPAGSSWPSLPPAAPEPPAKPAATAPPASLLPAGVEPSIYGLYLLVERGKDRGKVFPINRQVTVIGRSGTEVLIDDPDISRRHAALDVQGQGKYVLRDLASTNGTLLNGIAIRTENIAANDKIRMGSTTIKLVVGDERVATELQRLGSSPSAT